MKKGIVLTGALLTATVVIPTALEKTSIYLEITTNVLN